MVPHKKVLATNDQDIFYVFCIGSLTHSGNLWLQLPLSYLTRYCLLPPFQRCNQTDLE